MNLRILVRDGDASAGEIDRDRDDQRLGNAASAILASFSGVLERAEGISISLPLQDLRMPL